MYLGTRVFTSRSHALSIPDQIRALEELAPIDAELKDSGRAAHAGALDAGRRSSPASPKLDEKLAADRASLAAMDKHAERADHRRAQHDAAARALAREADRVAHRARVERRAARARGAPQAGARPRGRDRQAHRPTPTRSRQQIEATEAEHKKLVDELGAARGRHQLEARRASRRKAQREAGRARRGGEEAARRSSIAATR